MNLEDKFYMIFLAPLTVFAIRAGARLSLHFKKRRLYKYFNSQYNGMLWNGVIGFLYSNYLCLVIVALLQFEEDRI